MAFNIIVANIALLILIVTLAFTGYAMYKGKKEIFYNDVVIGECPDYWNMEKERNNNVCVNVKNLGKSTCSRKMNFFVPPWTSNDGVCQKYKWANNCDLTWDGITNNPTVCESIQK